MGQKIENRGWGCGKKGGKKTRKTTPSEIRAGGGVGLGLGLKTNRKVIPTAIRVLSAPPRG